MGLFKRNEIYYLEYKIDDKYKRISLKTKNKDLAEKMYNAFLLSQITDRMTSSKNVLIQKENRKSVARSNTPKEKQSKSISKVYSEYKDLCMTQNLCKSIMSSKERLNRLFEKKGIKYLNQIDQKFVSSIVTDFSKDNANRYMKNLKAFLNFCIKQRYYKREDLDSLTFLRQEENIRDIVIDEKDYQTLMNNCKDDDFKIYMMTLWETGVRPNEITSLKKSDIDFEKGSSKVYQSKTKKFKVVYFSDELLRLFKDIRTEYIFVGADKQKEYYAKKFRDLRESLNLNKDYFLYTFRHSFGTRILNKTKDIHLVSKLLGHSDISITARHYINRSDEEIREKLMG